MLVFAAVVSEKPLEREESRIDETLFQRIGEGDRDAFCRLYEQTANAVYAYALSLLRSREDAEDAMQETFLKIRSAAHLYKPMGKPMAWVLTIARNVSMMKFRQQKRSPVLPMEEMTDVPNCGEIEDREDRLVLEAAFKALSREDCQIIMLHAVSGLKHREIGDLLHLPLSTVLSRYHRGIQKLRGELEGKL